MELRKAHVTAALAQKRELEWQAHWLLTPTQDCDGDVAISLSDGKYGSGLMTKVDSWLWHALTFRRSYHRSAHGYAVASGGALLHTSVQVLTDPAYIPSRDASIDHKDPAAKLDNRISNLRVTTHSEQQRNKVRRQGTTSSHLGVSFSRSRNTWRGSFFYTTSDGPRNYQVQGKTEDAVTAVLNAKRIEVHGDKAVLGP